VGMVGALTREARLRGPFLVIEQARLLLWVQVREVGVPTDRSVHEHHVLGEVGGSITGCAQLALAGVVKAGVEELHGAPFPSPWQGGPTGGLR